VPKIVIVSQLDGYRVFDLNKERIIIGRGEDSDLLLPNISVSRHHAQILFDDGVASIEDLESSNGTMVNGKPTTGTVLSSGDEIVLGKFQLVYMGDGTENRFYNGRYLEYMLKYDAVPSRGVDDSTFSISPEQLRRQQEEAHKMRSAKLVLLKNPSRFWHPEDRGITMGDAGMVKVEGLFTGGVVAEISWNGKAHVLHKRGRLIKVMINDQGVSEQPLRSGDRVRVANTGFLYELGKME
jgi:pSer/pThr/pTyr-binding forkhead associated (FHA) protein